VIYAAYQGEEVRLVGGRAVTDWKPVTDPTVLSRVPEVARNQVLQADLRAQGITDFGDFSDPTTMRRTSTFTGGGLQLIFQDHLMPLSRWPREGWMHIVDLLDGQLLDGDKDRRVVGKFTYEGDRPSRWAGEKDAWAHGYWAYDFHDGRQKIESIDAARRVISLAPPHHHWGYRKGQWFYVFNLLAEIARPGDWCLDREGGLLYFWPPAPIAQGEAVVTLLQAPLVTLEDCSYVTLRGLMLEATRGAGVTVTGGTHDRIVGCTLRNLGGNAVIIEGGAANGVVDCEISGTGNGGISLSGGDRKTLTPAGHYAENNHIHHYSVWNRICNPAISLNGVGNRACHNLIHDAPHQAIASGGNDHLIEFNDIYNVCAESNDAGALYNGRDWTQRGTEIRYNFLHDIRGLNGRGANGVYLDDMLSGIEVRGNLFYRVYRALLLGGGRDNVIDNNVFVKCDTALHLDARCLGWGSEMLPTMRERLAAVPYREPPWSTRYPVLVDILSDKPEAPKGNVITRNVVWDGPMLSEHAKTVLQWFTVEANLCGQDPHFVDAAHLNFQLKADSPVWAKIPGFEPIPFEQIGRRPSEFVKQLKALSDGLKRTTSLPSPLP